MVLGDSKLNKSGVNLSIRNGSLTNEISQSHIYFQKIAEELKIKFLIVI